MTEKESITLPVAGQVEDEASPVAGEQIDT